MAESELKPGPNHIYKRRTFYLDEDAEFVEQEFPPSFFGPANVFKQAIR